MNEQYQLLIVLLIIALYCNYKYQYAKMLNAFWLFAIAIYAVKLMSNAELDFWFPLFIVLFNSMLQLCYIAKNYDRGN